MFVSFCHDQACKYFHACKWPSDLGSDDEALALYFDWLNNKYNDDIEEIKTNKNKY